jgi:hypothetical protein
LIDRLQLDAVDANPPLARRLVQHAAQLVVDLVPRGQRLLERHPADHVAQRRDRELLDALDVVGDLVGRRLRVGDLEVEDRVDVDDQVVLGDHRLRLERDDLLAQVDQRPQAVDERDHDREARGQRAVVAAEPLDHPGAGLGDDPDRARERDEHEHRNDGDDDERDHSFSYS